MNNLIYNIHDKPPVGKLIIYAIQQVMSIFVATTLIATICGTPISSCLVGACFATLIYQIFTRFSSPMFISSSGATCNAVIGALAVGGFKSVIAGGIIIAIVYGIFALIVKLKGVKAINKIFPPTLVGSVTIVIGANLATFIPTYVQVNGEYSIIGVIIALLTMIVTALVSRYGKGFIKTIPFLIGLVFGYIVSICFGLIDFSIFENIQLFTIPDFAFMHLEGNINWLSIIILFVPVSICAMLEHISDHKVLSNIIGTDLTETPGLDKTLMGDGIASLFGTIICGLPNTSYGESIATTGFSRVASVRVITIAAIITGLLGFLGPVQCFISSIPSCVFGGLSIILYGYIAASGLKTLVNNKVDLENNKNLIIVSSVLTIGVSGLWLFSTAFAGVSLAMVIGILLNILL